MQFVGAVLVIVALCVACRSTVEPNGRSASFDANRQEARPEGWFGYSFDLDRLDALQPGAVLADVTRQLDGEPVARTVQVDGTQRYIWYHECLEELRAVELVFRDDHLESVGERVRMHQGGIDYAAVPARLKSTRWLQYSESPRTGEDALFLQPTGRILAGFAYDHRADGALVAGRTTIAEAERILNGSPAWIADYADGTVRAAWFQITPTRGTGIELRFLPDGTLESVSSRSLQKSAPDWAPAVGTSPDEPIRVTELWKPSSR